LRIAIQHVNDAVRLGSFVKNRKGPIPRTLPGIDISDGEAEKSQYCGNAQEILILFDLFDSAHRTFFHTVATGDAGVLIHDSCGVMDDVQYVLWAGIDANSAGRALIGIDDWMWHSELLSAEMGFLLRRHG
jgi:hypothetical protein